MSSSSINFREVSIQVLFIVLGIYLFYIAMQNADMDTIMAYFRKLHTRPLFIILAISIIAYLIRTYRWKLLMDTEGKESNFWTLLFTIHASYFASLFVPRIGEVLKCVILSKIEKKPIAFIIGTSIVERIVDVVCYIILLIACIFMKFDFITSLFYTSIKNISQNSFIILGLSGLAFMIAAYFIYKKIKEKKLIHQMMTGLQSIGKVKNKLGFILASIAIFVCHFLTSYMVFFCFDETKHLGPLDGFVVMVCGTFTKMLPISGGSMGAYHLVIQNVMATFGIDKGIALSYAIVNHGFQLIYNTIFGILSYVLLSGKLRS